MSTAIYDLEKARSQGRSDKALIGRRVIYTTWEGERMEGTVESVPHGFAIIRFDDGRWARSDSRVEVVNA